VAKDETHRDVLATLVAAGSGFLMHHQARDAAKEAAMLLQQDEIEELLAEHEFAYAIMRWAEGAVVEAEDGWDELHDAWRSPSEALAWLLRHLSEIPKRHRPRAAHAQAVATLIHSLVRTSFWFSPAVRGDTCRCVLCDAAPRDAKPRDRAAWNAVRWKRAVPTRLAPRRLTRNDEEAAAELTRRCLEALAASLGVEATPSVATTSAARHDLERLTLAWQLRRRAEGMNQGKAPVVLWRRVTTRGDLTAASILDAQKRLSDALTRAHHERASRIRS
jgi:hypothetical protein